MNQTMQTKKYYIKNLITGSIIYLGTDKLQASLFANRWGKKWQLV